MIKKKKVRIFKVNVFFLFLVRLQKQTNKQKQQQQKNHQTIKGPQDKLQNKFLPAG